MRMFNLLILLLIVFSCESQEDKIITTFSDIKGKKW